MLGMSTRAELQISGTPEHVVLRANNATLEEVLSDIQSAFDVRIGLTGASNRQFTGSYSGTLRQIVARMLAGEDYVIGSAPNGFNVILLRSSGPTGGSAVAGSPALRANAERRAAIIDAADAGNPNFQGWVPARTAPLAASTSASPSESVATASPAPVISDEGNQEFQGWLPSRARPVATNAGAPPSETITIASEAPVISDEGNPEFQGWLPSRPSAANDGAPSSQTIAIASLAPVISDEGNPEFQGWLPSRPVAEPVGAKAP
jgi:hypothetical protein